MFLIPVFALFYPGNNSRSVQTALWTLAGVFYTLIIGLRVEVGGDWLNYLAMLSIAKFPGELYLITSDPGYAFLNRLIALVDGNIYMVNLVCGSIFMSGLILFCRRQPLPWLGLLIAVPYMIIVLGMGYTRQGVAFGLELLALNALMDRRTLHFLLLIFFAGLFHKSAVLLAPLAALSSANGNRLWTFLWVGITSLVFAILLLGEFQHLLWQNYVSSKKSSEGGAIRVALTAIPATLLLLYHKKFFNHKEDARVWIWMSILTLVCLPLVTIASTAVDRIALYLMPLQIFVFTRLPLLFANPLLRSACALAIVCFYALVLFVWLNFANHASSWVPYKFAFFQ